MSRVINIHVEEITMTQDKLSEKQAVRSQSSRSTIGPLALSLILAGSFMPTSAMAHITPIDIGDFNLGTAVTTTERNNGLSGDKGWIDGTDGDWGDTHAFASYSFSLVGEGSADVTLALRGKSNAFGGAGLSPGFTLYEEWRMSAAIMTFPSALNSFVLPTAPPRRAARPPKARSGRWPTFGSPRMPIRPAPTRAPSIISATPITAA